MSSNSNNNNNNNNNSSLRDRIVQFLQKQSSPKAAAQIVKHVGSCKKVINGILYQLLRERQVVKTILQGTTKPVWSSMYGNHVGDVPGGYPPYQQPGPEVFLGGSFGGWFPGVQHVMYPYQGGPPVAPPQQHHVHRYYAPHPQQRGRGAERRGWGNRGRGGGGGYMEGGGGWRGGKGNRGHWRGGGGNRGRGGSKGNYNASTSTNAPNRPTSHWHSHFQNAAPNQKHKNFSQKRMKGEGSKGAPAMEFEDGESGKAATLTAPAPDQKASSGSVTKPAASAATQPTPSPLCAVSQAESVAQHHPGSMPNTTLESTTLPAALSGLGPSDHQGDVSSCDNASDRDSASVEEDCDMEDLEAGTLAGFQDMWGTLVLNDLRLELDENMPGEEPALVGSSSNILIPEHSSLAAHNKKLSETGEDLFTGCPNKADTSHTVHSPTPISSGEARAAGNLQPSCSSLFRDLKATSSQGDLQRRSVPASSNTRPPLPPKEWLDSHSTSFTPSPPQAVMQAASTVSSEQEGIWGQSKNCATSTALVPLMGGRGRGLPALSLNKWKSKSPGSSAAVGELLDVRDVESQYFAIPPPPPIPQPPSIPPSAPGRFADAASVPQTSGSETESSFRRLEDFKWVPLKDCVERLPQDASPSSSSSLSLQSSLTGHGDQGPTKSPVTSERCQPPSQAGSSSWPDQTGPAPPGAVAQQMCVEESAPVHSQAGGMECMPDSISPSSWLPSLQKFAAEGLTFIPAPASSATHPSGSSGPATVGSGASSLPFQKPLTPMELIGRQRGNMTTMPHSCYGQASSNDRDLSLSASSSSSSSSFSFSSSPPSSSSSYSSMIVPQSHGSPHPATFASPPSLPAMGVEERGGAAALQISSESFAALNKNPISALMEHAQSRHTTATLEVLTQRGPSHRPVFVMAARVGNRLFQSITCHNKKDGKKEAADVALRILMAEGQLSAVSPNPSGNMAAEDMTHFDRTAALTHQAFNTLIAGIPESLAGRKVIAGLVMKRSPQDQGTVVSLGSGNRCITGDKLSLEGNTVNDSHAEIITRRGFLRFLYQQLLLYQEGKPHELFEPGGGGKLKVKKGVTFHLYISTAPCGDGALFSPRDTESNSGPITDTERREHRPTFSSTVQGLLRTKMEGGEGTIPVDSKDLTIQAWDGIVRGERLRTMSCTDKICRWNVLGLQGALLSHFLEPVYLDSLTLGFLYDHGHLSRAVCCRLARGGEAQMEQALAPGFHLNHPWLGRVTACQPLRETQKTKAFSINWSFGDSAPEVVDGTVGHCYTAVEKKLFSRVSKRNLYDSFKRVADHLGRNDLSKATSYREAKLAAKDFQTSKAAMFSQFRLLGCGWVKKPPEEEMFS